MEIFTVEYKNSGRRFTTEDFRDVLKYSNFDAFESIKEGFDEETIFVKDKDDKPIFEIIFKKIDD